VIGKKPDFKIQSIESEGLIKKKLKKPFTYTPSCFFSCNVYSPKKGEPITLYDTDGYFLRPLLELLSSGQKTNTPKSLIQITLAFYLETLKQYVDSVCYEKEPKDFPSHKIFMYKLYYSDVKEKEDKTPWTVRINLDEHSYKISWMTLFHTITIPPKTTPKTEAVYKTTKVLLKDSFKSIQEYTQKLARVMVRPALPINPMFKDYLKPPVIRLINNKKDLGEKIRYIVPENALNVRPFEVETLFKKIFEKNVFNLGDQKPIKNNYVVTRFNALYQKNKGTFMLEWSPINKNEECDPYRRSLKILYTQIPGVGNVDNQTPTPRGDYDGIHSEFWKHKTKMGSAGPIYFPNFTRFPEKKLFNLNEQEKEFSYWVRYIGESSLKAFLDKINEMDMAYELLHVCDFLNNEQEKEAVQEPPSKCLKLMP